MPAVFRTCLGMAQPGPLTVQMLSTLPCGTSAGSEASVYPSVASLSMILF